MAEVGKLLFYTWGVQSFLRVPVVGRVPLKTSPSGGARHPEEVYVLAINVEGLEPGLYHYLPREHALELMGRRTGLHRRAARYCGGQRWVGKAAALFLMTVVFDRNRWKYRMARGYRVLLAEAGHLAQTFCLVATAAGLAPFTTMALADAEIERDLRLDSQQEAVLYVSGVGRPK
jgi:SagB-type dehydrogenase family enzyme